MTAPRAWGMVLFPFGVIFGIFLFIEGAWLAFSATPNRSGLPPAVILQYLMGIILFLHFPWLLLFTARRPVWRRALQVILTLALAIPSTELAITLLYWQAANGDGFNPTHFMLLAFAFGAVFFRIRRITR